MFFVHAHNRWHHWYRLDRILWLVQSIVVSLITPDEIGDLWMESYRGIPNMYLHIFSAREMTNLLEGCGFRDVRLVYINERRNAELDGAWFRRVRANGFIGSGTKA